MSHTHQQITCWQIQQAVYRQKIFQLHTHLEHHLDADSAQIYCVKQLHLKLCKKMALQTPGDLVLNMLSNGKNTKCTVAPPAEHNNFLFATPTRCMATTCGSAHAVTTTRTTPLYTQSQTPCAYTQTALLQRL
jgi:hypothetical protein